MGAPMQMPTRQTQTDIFNYVDPEASLAPWYLVGKPRKDVKKDATKVLRSGHIGEFFVRDISSHPGCLGLSIKTSPDDLMNYLLQPQANNSGVSVRGTKEVFPTLSRLISHYSAKRRPSLPVQLIEPSFGRVGKGKKKNKRGTNGRKGNRQQAQGHRQRQQPVAAAYDDYDEDEDEEDEEGGFGFDADDLAAAGGARRGGRDASHAVSQAHGAARRPSLTRRDVERARQEAEAVTASRVAAAINSSVKDAVGSQIDEFTQQHIENVEHRIAKKRAMIEKRRLALLQERGEESKRTLETLEDVFPSAPTSSLGGGGGAATQSSMVSLAALERERGSRPVSPQERASLPAAESVIGDPAAMWDAIVKSDATSSVKLNAAKKQLLYFQQEEQLIQEKLAEAERALLRPRKFSENDTVFDDNFENGTIIDDTGEIFGFGAL